jgi:hypothetical protein
LCWFLPQGQPVTAFGLSDVQRRWTASIHSSLIPLGSFILQNIDERRGLRLPKVRSWRAFYVKLKIWALSFKGDIENITWIGFHFRMVLWPHCKELVRERWGKDLDSWNLTGLLSSQVLLMNFS